MPLTIEWGYQFMAKNEAQEKVDQINHLTAEMRAVDSDERKTDAEKREQIERINTDIAALTAEVRAIVEQGEREAEVRSLTERASALFAPGSVQEKREAAYDLDAEIRSLGKGDTLDILAGGGLDFRAAGANTAKLTDSAWAGTTVQNKFVAEILKSLTETSPILQAGVRVITTATGEKMEWPVKNGKIVAAKVAEGATYGKSKGSFTRWTIDNFKYGVIAEATQEMLRDSQVPLASIIAEDIGESLADATNADFVKGDGVTMPHGIVPATVLSTPLANKAAVTSDALVTFTHSVLPKYRANAKFYVSDDFVLSARLLKDGEGRYIWQNGLDAGAPDTLLGKRVVTDVLMDGMVGAGKVPVLFGDFSKYLVRFVGSVNLSRSDEYGWDSDVVAWKGNVKVDGGLTDAAALSKIVLTA